MKKLGDLILPEALQWTDRHNWSPVAMDQARTLGGGLVTWSSSLKKGRIITLDAQSSVLWLPENSVNTIKTMAAGVGTTLTLVWGTETYRVMFRHFDPPAVEFQPVRPNSGCYFGTIKLIEV